MTNTNLVDSLFSKRHQFESAILCTYGLDLNFIENYLLKLDALYLCDHIAIFTDATTYDGLTASYAPRLLNRRYLVSRLVAGGVFHSKLYMLASARKAQFAITSANLTRDGISSNLELLATFEVSERDSRFAQLLQDCVDYSYRLAELTGSQLAIAQVEDFNDLCGAFMPQGTEAAPMRLVHNLERPILDQIVEYLAPYHVIRFEVVSPFFDHELLPLKTLCSSFPKAECDLFIQQKRSNFPVAAFPSHRRFAGLRLFINVPRYIHGKALVAQCEEATFAFIGSANFTSPALLQMPDTGNFEIGVIGPIEDPVIDEILKPAGYEACANVSEDEIEVSAIPEFRGASKDYFNYLLEAVLQDDGIHITARSDCSPADFNPITYRLMDLDKNTVEGRIIDQGLVRPSKKDFEKLHGSIAIQFLGKNKSNEFVASNLMWVIDLEVRTGDQKRRRLDRIYSNPAELFEVLWEISDQDGDHELLMFLKTFDIPLDLVLPPRLSKGARNVKSKGNLIGSLPLHKNAFLSGPILGECRSCLERLLSKLRRHRENPQPDKMHNFILIYSSLLILMDFINSWTFGKSYSHAVITSDEWLLIRDCYNLLLEFSTKAWQLVWGENGYRNVIDANLAEWKSDERDMEGTISFKDALLAEYDDSVTEFTEFSLRPIRQFRQLLGFLQIDTPTGTRVKPKIFPARHPYLEPSTMSDLERHLNDIQLVA